MRRIKTGVAHAFGFQASLDFALVLPAGFELPRLALSVPLFISTVLVALTAVLDIVKLAAGMPENVTDHHPEV